MMKVIIELDGQWHEIMYDETDKSKIIEDLWDTYGVMIYIVDIVDMRESQDSYTE